MRLFSSTLLALGLATTLVAQQNSATNPQQPAAASSTASQPTPTAPPPGNVILHSQPIIVQKGTMAVPIAVGTPTQQPPAATAPPTAPAPQPQATAPVTAPAPQPTPQPAFRQEQLVIQKTDQAVPIAVGNPAQPQATSPSSTD